MLKTYLRENDRRGLSEGFTGGHGMLATEAPPGNALECTVRVRQFSS